MTLRAKGNKNWFRVRVEQREEFNVVRQEVEWEESKVYWARY